MPKNSNGTQIILKISAHLIRYSNVGLIIKVPMITNICQLNESNRLLEHNLGDTCFDLKEMQAALSALKRDLHKVKSAQTSAPKTALA